jgi:hypothetical protein
VTQVTTLAPEQSRHAPDAAPESHDSQPPPEDDGGLANPAAAASEPYASSLTPEEEAELSRIKDLPKEVGVMLLTVGVLGFVLPGVVGTPAAIAGGLVLWPKAFGKVENWFERRFPETHKHSLYQINRFLDDLDARYPSLPNDA